MKAICKQFRSPSDTCEFLTELGKERIIGVQLLDDRTRYSCFVFYWEEEEE